MLHPLLLALLLSTAPETTIQLETLQTSPEAVRILKAKELQQANKHEQATKLLEPHASSADHLVRARILRTQKKYEQATQIIDQALCQSWKTSKN